MVKASLIIILKSNKWFGKAPENKIKKQTLIAYSIQNEILFFEKIFHIIRWKSKLKLKFWDACIVFWSITGDNSLKTKSSKPIQYLSSYSGYVNL